MAAFMFTIMRLSLPVVVEAVISSLVDWTWDAPALALEGEYLVSSPSQVGGYSFRHLPVTVAA